MRDKLNEVTIICAECGGKSVVHTDFIDDIDHPICMSCAEALNPFLMFQTIRTKLLVQIMEGELDPYELIKNELKSRYMVRDGSGKWIQK
jgi:hypothetical protein